MAGRPDFLMSSHRESLSSPKVVMVGGFGYGNTGDEAQLGANISLWKHLFPSVEITVLSPNPAYTEAEHGVKSVAASRVLFFGAAYSPDYFCANGRFKRRFWMAWLRLGLGAELRRREIPCGFLGRAENDFLEVLANSDVLHVSGGGFLTGMTKSRLWDCCMIMDLSRRLGVPFFLTGQTIGVFQSSTDCRLARSSLTQAVKISLRDPGLSKKELMRIGVPETIMVDSVDDALFCERVPEQGARRALASAGLYPEKRFVAINFHWWGMDEAMQAQATTRMKEVIEFISATVRCQILLIPMTPDDEKPQRALLDILDVRAGFLRYDYNYKLVRGVLALAYNLISFKHHPLIFALGEGVPSLSISLDDYYARKNTGALANIGMAEWSLRKSDFFGKKILEAVSKLAAERCALSSRIAQEVASYKDIQARVFKEAVGAATDADVDEVGLL